MHYRLLTLLFYLQKPLMPRSFQIFLRRKVVRYQRKKYVDIWPIDERAGYKPPEFTSWPNNKKFALVLTHDVESQKGYEKCKLVIDLEKSMGFRSSFNFVPERYKVSPQLRQYLSDNGFEVGVHGLKHDGLMYFSKKDV